MDDVNQINTGRRWFYPIHRVICIIDELADAQSAVDALHESGFADDKIVVLVGPEGAKVLDLEGSKHGRFGQLIRAVQHFADEEFREIERHVREMEAGKIALAVLTDDSDAQVEQIHQIMKNNKGRNIMFFGTFSTRELY